LLRLTTVRVTVWRARFIDDTWFAIMLPSSKALNCQGKSGWAC
jgi:hypothetical protein